MFKKTKIFWLPIIFILIFIGCSKEDSFLKPKNTSVKGDFNGFLKIVDQNYKIVKSSSLNSDAEISIEFEVLEQTSNIPKLKLMVFDKDGVPIPEANEFTAEKSDELINALQKGEGSVRVKFFSGDVLFKTFEELEASFEKAKVFEISSVTDNNFDNLIGTYLGYIHKYPIKFIIQSIDPDSRKVEGILVYTKFNKPFDISGQIKDNNELILNETHKGQITGRIKAKAENDKINGTWSTPDYKKNLIFSVTWQSMATSHYDDETSDEGNEEGFYNDYDNEMYGNYNNDDEMYEEGEENDEIENNITNDFDDKLDKLEAALKNWVKWAKKTKNGENVYLQLNEATLKFAKLSEEIATDIRNGELTREQYDRYSKIYDKYMNYIKQGY